MLEHDSSTDTTGKRRRKRKSKRDREKGRKKLSREPIFKSFACGSDYYFFLSLFVRFVRSPILSRALLFDHNDDDLVCAFFVCVVVGANEKPIGNMHFAHTHSVLSSSCCVHVRGMMIIMEESSLRNRLAPNNHYLRMPSVCYTSFEEHLMLCLASAHQFLCSSHFLFGSVFGFRILCNCPICP